MIISASYRADIPAFHGRWFTNRLAAGWCAVKNPYGGGVSRVSLAREDVDGFVFWTKNLGPFMEALDGVDAAGFPFVVQYTVTALPRALERAVTPPERAIGHLRRVRDRWGPRAAVWRYDPIAITSLTPPEWHVERFRTLAAELAGVVDEVVVSFLQPYRKTARNLDRAAVAGGFSWRDPDMDEKTDLIGRLSETVLDHRMNLTLCTQPALVAASGMAGSACIDARRLSDVAGREIGAAEKGNRQGCLCVRSRDIGAYDTCPHGCAYCYAVSNHDSARRRYHDHDPENPRLI